MIKELSVTFPCYNEESNIENTINTAIPIIKKTAKNWEVIIVNDGSTDRSLEKIKKLQKKWGKNIVLINHPKNRGYGAAFKSCFYNASYQLIAFTDADGQFDFSEVKYLIKNHQSTKADLVIGYYLKRQVPFTRKVGTFIWQTAVYILYGLKVRDIDCGFKLITKKVIDTIPKLESERGPFITSEFLIKAQKMDFKISEVGVHHFERQGGKATGSNLNVVISGLKDLINLKKKLSNL